MYSQDTYGLGHLRRNLEIAGRLRRRVPDARVALLAGVPDAESWPRPPGVEIIQLPSVVKVATDRYRAAQDRHLTTLLAERAGIAAHAVLTEQPAVFLVDHAPLGVKGELRLAIRYLRQHSPRTRLVLGLRDILDDPAVHRRNWARLGVYQALENHYDRVLIYGSENLYDTAGTCALNAAVRRRTTYVGYIGKEASSEPPDVAIVGWSGPAGRRRSRVLVMGGGGRDAAGLFHAFMDAWPGIRSSTHAVALLVTGPLMDEASWKELGARAGGLEDLRLVSSSRAMLHRVAEADVVVSMGGYNSVVEVLGAGKPLVVRPRRGPSQEQTLRARMLERMGLARLVMPDEAPEVLAACVQEALNSDPPDPAALQAIDFRGGDRVVDALLELAGSRALAYA
jgi:predicted glycosyltransferase